MESSEEPSRRAMDAALYKTLGSLEANVETTAKQTAELFGLVRELREDVPTKAEMQAIAIEQRNHMAKDLADHNDFRESMKGFAALLYDPHDDTKGLVPEHRELMETHNSLKGIRKAAVWLFIIVPPGFAALVELWEKVLLPLVKHAVAG